VGVFLGAASTQYLIVKNFNRAVLAVAVSAALLNFCLNLAWIRIWGIQGAALATLAAYSLIPILNISIQIWESRKPEISRKPETI
jgi:Na+-driven multidrug efflux pump